MENLGRRRFNVEQIHERGLSKQHTVKVKKIPGVTTETILEKLENLLESKPGMLIVHAGTNHCVKSVQIRSFSVPYFPIFSPNMGKYGPEKLRIWTLFPK